MIQRIHIINGPNLNLLGKREPEIYGSISFESYFKEIKKKYDDIHFDYTQSNHEGVIIDLLHQIGFESGIGIILNAGGLSHTSVSLRDAVSSIDAPVVEVHISDIYQREPFRHHSFLNDVCVAHFIGKGLQGYDLAVEYLMNHQKNL